MRARNVTSKHIIFWKKDMLEKGYSINYLSNIYVTLSAIFNFDVKFHGLKENSCRLVGKK